MFSGIIECYGQYGAIIRPASRFRRIYTEIDFFKLHESWREQSCRGMLSAYLFLTYLQYEIKLTEQLKKLGET